jgi:transposase-like protein
VEGKAALSSFVTRYNLVAQFVGDETSINIKKVWTYLYRAVDSQGNTLEFLLSPKRDAEAAKRFFLKALGSCTNLGSQAGTSKEKETHKARWHSLQNCSE